jgi:molybdate transport system substrate-binding protein
MRRSVVALLAALVAGCGGDGDDGSGPPVLTVAAAASLTEALERCAPAFEAARVRLVLGGSDELAAQVRQGLPFDVVAAANTAIPEALRDEGLADAPRVFATNELVLAVPAREAAVEGLEDLAAPDRRLVVGGEEVPVGAYTRAVLDRLPAGQAAAIRRNVRSEEPDVKGVVAKLAQGAADAGFVYRSDVRAADGRLRAIALPPRLRPQVAYGAAVLRRTGRRFAAEAFVEDLATGGCGRALRAAGLGAPPSS